MAGRDQVAAFIEEAKEEVEAYLDGVLPAAETPPLALHQAMRYSLFAGGKRLRPALVIASCLALGGERAQALPLAAAFEMVHTYSLVHDDLPCMDDDDYRRGRPTCHKVYGEALAVLAGDALLTGAFGLLAERPAPAGSPPEVVAVLARAAGSLGMVGGQALDLAGEGGKPSLEAVREIHLRKTAAMIAGCLEGGALAGGAPAGEARLFGRAGELLGLAFQIRDDLLDESGDARTLGKTPGKDREAGKLTWPACVGAEKSAAQAESMVDQALDHLAEAGAGAGILAEVARRLVRRDN